MTRRILLSFFNFITYLFVATIVIVYASFLYAEYSTGGLIYWGGAFFALLFLAFLVGFVLSRCFPDRRSSQFSFLFNVIELVCIMIILMAGVELSLQSIEGLKFIDEWELVFISKSLITGGDLFEISAIADGFFKQAGLYPTSCLFRVVVPVVQQLVPGIEATDVILKTMLTVHILIGLLTYRCARLLSGRVASISVFALMMLLPSQMYSPSVLNIYAVGSMFAMAQLWIFLLSRRMARKEDPLWGRFLMDVIAAVFAGLASFCNPAFFLLIPAEVIYICLFQKNRSGCNPESYGVRWGHNCILVFGTLATAFGMMCIQAYDMKAEIESVLFGSFEPWLLKGDFVSNFLAVWSNENYVDQVISFGDAYVNAISYGCLLGIAFICLIFCWFLKERDLFVLEIVLLSIGVFTSLNGTETIMHIAAIPILSIFAGALFDKVYSALRRQAFAKMNAIAHAQDGETTEQGEATDQEETTEQGETSEQETIENETDESKLGGTEILDTEISDPVSEDEYDDDIPLIIEEILVMDDEETVSEEQMSEDVMSEDLISAGTSVSDEELVILRVDDVIAMNHQNANGEPGIFDRLNQPKYDLEIKEYPQDETEPTETEPVEIESTETEPVEVEAIETVEDRTVDDEKMVAPVTAEPGYDYTDDETETNLDFDYETSSDDDYDYYK